MKRLIVFTAMFAVCLAHLAAEEFPNKKCFEFFPVKISYNIHCIAQACGGQLIIFWRLAGCSDVADVVCTEFVVPIDVSYAAISVNVPPGMGSCGVNNDLICMPDFSNGVVNWGPQPFQKDCL